MIIWVLILCLIAATSMYLLPEDINSNYPMIILIAILGILYRIHWKKTEKKIWEMEKRYKELRRRVGDDLTLEIDRDEE